MKRYGMVIGLRAEKLNEYKQLRAAAWPEVLKLIKQCHIQNYSIYLRDQVKVIVGAVPLTQGCAEGIGADAFSESAAGAVAAVRRVTAA